MDDLLRINTSQETLECSNCSDDIEPGDEDYVDNVDEMMKDLDLEE